MPDQKSTETNKSSSEGRPLSKKVPPRPTLSTSVPPALRQLQKRQEIKPLQPGASSKRVQDRNLRRWGSHKTANQVQSNRPRPVVRPGPPPVKVMPKTQPPPTNLKTLRKTPQPAKRLPPSTSGRIAFASASAGFVVLNVAAAHVDINSEVSSLNSTLQDLQKRSTFESLQADIVDLDNQLKRVLDLLESARDKDYRYQADMEQIAFGASSRWETLRPQLENKLRLKARQMQTRVSALNPQVERLNANLYSTAAATPHLRNLQNQANNLLNELSRAERELNGDFDDLETQTYQLNERLTDIHWALEQSAEAKFELQHGEDLVMGVPTRWDTESKDDPEGVLYLTNQRLIFEQKEKVATKKVLFLTTSSELVQEILIDQPLENLQNYKAERKGLFGHQDFLQVQFAERQVGQVAFHLDGQDSKDWAVLLERARSGKIEEQRVSAGGGLSVSDLTRTLTKADLLAMQEEVNALQDEMLLKGVQTELAELENDVQSLARKLADLRAKGYLIEKDLEADISILSAQLDRIKSNAEKTIRLQTQNLNSQMRSIQTDLSQLMGMSTNLTAARPLYMQVKSAVASAEAGADAAQSTVLAQYDQYADEVESLDAHFEWVAWMMEALANATFRLLATESGVAASEAIYSHPTLGPENGILFLTDQRLLWEDRVGEYELKLEIPLQYIKDVHTETEADSQRDILVFQFTADAPLAEARLTLALPVAEDWLTMVGRARSGGYVEDRAVPISTEELERVKNAPRQCPNCGAAFSAPILRGQIEINCEYCGVVSPI